MQKVVQRKQTTWHYQKRHGECATVQATEVHTQHIQREAYLVLAVDGAAELDQELHQLQVALAGRQMQRREAL
jgi:hypothetical protein